MPPRAAYWKGYLKLSLVTCPVLLLPAGTAQDRISLRTLNSRTGNPVVSRWVDEVTGRAVDDDDRALGYPRGEGDHVVLEDDDLDAIRLESARTIDIEVFVPEGSISWIWYDRPHYLVPGEAVGEEAFAVIRAAMAATRMCGIARLVLHGRERAVLLRARDRGFVLWTLRYGDEVRPPVAKVATDAIPDDQRKLMARLIEDRVRPWDPAKLDDPVQADLRRIIEAKARGRKPRKAKAEPAAPPDNVVSIMDALRRSLDAERRR